MYDVYEHNEALGSWRLASPSWDTLDAARAYAESRYAPIAAQRRTFWSVVAIDPRNRAQQTVLIRGTA
jgi:hypothetical protein